MVPRLDKCWDADVLFFFFKFFFCFFVFVMVIFFDLASSRVCPAVSKCFIWKGETMRAELMCLSSVIKMHLWGGEGRSSLVRIIPYDYQLLCLSAKHENSLFPQDSPSFLMFINFFFLPSPSFLFFHPHLTVLISLYFTVDLRYCTWDIQVLWFMVLQSCFSNKFEIQLCSPWAAAFILSLRHSEAVCSPNLRSHRRFTVLECRNKKEEANNLTLFLHSIVGFLSYFFNPVWIFLSIYFFENLYIYIYFVSWPILAFRLPPEKKKGEGGLCGMVWMVYKNLDLKKKKAAVFSLFWAASQSFPFHRML